MLCTGRCPDSDSVSLFVVNNSSEPLTIAAHVKIAIASVVEISEQVAVDMVNDVLDVSVHRVVSDGIENPNVGMGKSEFVVGEVAREGVAEDPLSRPSEEYVFSDGTKFCLPPGLNLKGLCGEQAGAAASLIQRHKHAFSANPLDLGNCDLIPHEIKLTDSKPVNLPYRRIMPGQMSEVKRLLQDLLDRKIIRKSASSYSSPIVLVKKKSGQLRLCIDYRCLNAKTQ